MKFRRIVLGAPLPGFALGILMQPCVRAAPPQRGVQDITPVAAPAPIGPYYALVIGNNNYQSRGLATLRTPRGDAASVAQALTNSYGFRVKVLYDATRDDILKAFNEYRRTLPAESSLLIYYAGHGHHDRETREAYWLPVDAEVDNNANWISSADITADVRAIRSKHILIISDSCFSGVLTRDAGATINPRERNAFLDKMLKSPSRSLMSSGGDEPVADDGAPGHSIFAGALLESLGREDNAFTAAELFQTYIQQGVAGRSDQTPQYGPIRNSGHEYGDFVFFRSRNNLATHRRPRELNKPFESPASKEDLPKPVSQPSRSTSAEALTGSGNALSELLKGLPSGRSERFLWLHLRSSQIMHMSKTIYIDAAKLQLSGIPIAQKGVREAVLKNPQFPSLNLQIVDYPVADLLLSVAPKKASVNVLANGVSGNDDLSFELSVSAHAFPLTLFILQDQAFARTNVSVPKSVLGQAETAIVAGEIVGFLSAVTSIFQVK